MLTSCPVLHSDSHLLAVDKPHGVLSHPNSARETAPCAFEGSYDLKREEFISPEGSVHLLHRIDQDTSGVLLAALDEAAAAKCRAAFEGGLVRKVYLALVSGLPAQRGVWKDHLVSEKAGGRVRTRALRTGPPNAEMRQRVVTNDYGTRLSLLEIELITGRTHQIRVQAAARHHPVAGDDIYGDFALNRRLRSEFGLRRLFLHAASLELAHPQTGKPLRIEAPLPVELKAVLEQTGLSRGGRSRR